MRWRSKTSRLLLASGLAAALLLAWSWRALTSAPSGETSLPPDANGLADEPPDARVVELEREVHAPVLEVGSRRPAERPPAPVVQRDPPPAPTEVELATWGREIAGKSPADLRELAQSIETSMNRAAALALRARQEAVQHDEIVGYGPRFRVSDFRAADEGRFVCYTFPPGKTDPHGAIGRTVLPADNFPELYAMKRHTTWLRARADELRAPK